MLQKFTSNHLKKLWQPDPDSGGEDNGQVTIVGGSTLFQGAPLLSATAASRIVDMVFVATPSGDRSIVDKTELFSKLKSVIWIPRTDLDAYVEKSDAALIGPGLMRYHTENGKNGEQGRNNEEFDQAGTETRMLTKYLLHKFSGKRWVIDGGSLQVIDASWIPNQAVLTPNKKEFELLFRAEYSLSNIQELARKYKCVIVGKGPTSYVSNGVTTYEIDGGNAGLTKGGTGDTLAGVIVGLLAKNDSLLSAAVGTWIVKKTAELLHKTVGLNFNADDVAENVFKVFSSLTK